MIFLSRIKRAVVSSVLFVLILLSLSRCDYSTKIISSANSPDIVFSDFISALKEKNFDRADFFLAYDATIKPVNETGYVFFDDYVDASLNLLDYELIGKPEINGTDATLNVRISSFDKNDFISWTKNNISQIEHEYMVDQGLKYLDKEDSKVIDRILIIAIKKYSETSHSLTSEITVDFVFTKKQWKIAGSDDLIIAIFGGE